MIVGYVRLSRDDDKKNYSSIENQKEMITKYALQNGMKIDKFYEDDGVSGYLFNRPAFSEMLERLEDDINIVIAKDLSRIGRNNAKVLMLLDRFQELEKRLILIDDNYDTLKTDDDIIGIKTWYNERYVKDTSKKIRAVIKMKQKDGEYVAKAPLGYFIKSKKFYIRENESELVKRVFDMYISGYGYRNISNTFNEENVPTPSVLIHQNTLAEGKESKRQVATKWSDNMVRDILKNDFYIGVFRNNKRERKTIHGADKRVKKEDQYVFNNHHKPIIEKEIFDLAQELMVSRKRSNYRGSKNNNEVSLFSSVLFCADCGAKLTGITRRDTNKDRKYYVCSKYNSDGKNFCTSHLVDEKKITDITLNYIDGCRNRLESLIESFDINAYRKSKDKTQSKIVKINKKIDELKEKLKSVIAMKLKDLSKYDGNTSFIEDTYSSMQDDIINDISRYEKELLELENLANNSYEEKYENINNAYRMLNNIGKNLTRKDLELIINKILVYEGGNIKIILKYHINDYIDYSAMDILNEEENKIIRSVLKFIKDEDRPYTSAKYLSKKVNEIGINKSKKSILPYIKLAILNGILEETEDPLKPYTIIMERAKIDDVIKRYIDTR